jgi:hypothetical protein
MKKMIIELIVYFSMFYGFMFFAYGTIYQVGVDGLKASFAIMFFGGVFVTKFFDACFCVKRVADNGKAE